VPARGRDRRRRAMPFEPPRAGRTRAPTASPARRSPGRSPVGSYAALLARSCAKRRRVQLFGEVFNVSVRPRARLLRAA
jgi:hypothetical protein